MAHRSNQVVASQDRASETPDEPPTARRLLVGWATALAALGVSTCLVGLGVWLARIPLAEFMIGAALAERGAEADFDVAELDFSHVVLTNIRFGSDSSPDAAAPRADARWVWEGLTPRLESIRIMEPQLRLRLDQGGRISAGTLDRLGAGAPGRRRSGIPRVELEIVEGQALIEAPFGTLTASLRAEGRLGEDFSAIAQIADTTLASGDYSLNSGSGELVIVSRDNALTARLSAEADGLTWAEAAIGAASVRAQAETRLDLGRFDIEALWRVASAQAPNINASQLAGAANFEAVARDEALAIGEWVAQARASAATLDIAGTRTRSTRLELRGEGEGVRANARWTLGAEHFIGLALTSTQPSATGRITRGENGALGGDALVTLAASSLDARAQERIRAAFPNLSQAPVGPTFAQAEAALDRAADSFTLTLPFAIVGGEQFSLVMNAPAEARAANGVSARLAPLRQDTPALALQWPDRLLSGAVELTMSGGGAPTSTLLLDTLTWAPGAPFEADGTLTLANWRADGASIATNELGVGIAVQPNGSGRVDLKGPAQITGPLGDGEVRDLIATLDLVVAWGEGWRVTPNGCLPMRVGGVDAAGLSLGDGAFSLCPQSGALIAADSSRNLSGGFSVRSLALNGQMAGENGAPARLRAANIVGQFSGRTGDMTLALRADAPALTIEMAEARTLSLAMQRITADARIAQSWSVEGAFEAGSLTDPSLPGSVSTIVGAWSAAPENNRPVIRVTTGEALLTAHPPTQTQRLLFHPLRLTNMNGVLQNGRIDANGEVLLVDDDNGDRQIAQFIAFHEVSEGVGGSRVEAERITFGSDLQPYDISETARGLVDNVRGDAGLSADITWTRDAIASTGYVRLNGISLATSTIPVVEDVRGDIYFDDLFALTTPSGQSITVGALNPGVAVSDGVVRFQLLPEQQVAIEHAEFAFASGRLAMAPTTITLGADETSFSLTLRDVDAAALLSTFNVPDLTATGRLEGSFPLRLTRTSAYVDGGVVRAQGEGGVISYTGNAGADASGPARIAFDALRSFRYDALSLTLDGDLNGDVISSIAFSGRNSGQPVDLGPIAPVPGLGRVTVRGVPFLFNVQVTAPFRRLAQTAATITDPGSLINQGREPEEAPQEQVDPVAPGTR